MADMICGFVPRKQDPLTKREMNNAIKRELRERELEQKWKDGTISKYEAAELGARKFSKILNSDTYIKSTV